MIKALLLDMGCDNCGDWVRVPTSGGVPACRKENDKVRKLQTAAKERARAAARKETK